MATDRDQAQEQRDDLRAVLDTPEGKRVLFRILAACGVYSDAFSGERSATDYLVGKQAIGKQLITWLNDVSPFAYPQLLLDVERIRAAETSVQKEPDDEE